MRDELKKRYDYAAWCERRPNAGRHLLKGFEPWKRDCLDWQRQARQHLRETSVRWLRRSIWSPSDDPDRSVLIEVRETASAAEARECLLEILGQNELARLPEAPTGVGDIGFVHPDGQTPAAFWATGNLCVTLLSLGLRPVTVLEWAHHLVRRMSLKPRVEADDLEIRSSERRLEVGKETTVEIAWPAAESDEAFVQIFSDRADLRFENGEVFVRAQQEGPVRIEAFAVEPDRPTRGGRVDLTARKMPR